jgi:hypothetical protein
MKKGFLTYSLSSAFFDMAANLMRSFGLVFFYIKSGENIYVALGAYALSSCFALVFLYTFAKFIGRIGTKYALLISRIAFLSATLPILILDEYNYLQVLLIWSFLYGLAKAMYFIPQHYMIINMTDKLKRGNSIGMLMAISSLIGIFSPFVAGFISSNYGNVGYAVMIGIAFLMSAILLQEIPNMKFRYTGEIKDSLNLKNIKRELRYSIFIQLQSQDGFWQVNIFRIFQNSFIELGVITTLVNLIGAMFNMVLGKWLDKHDRLQALKITGFMQGSGWLMRLLVNTPLGVLVSDSYMQLSNRALSESSTVFTYDLLSVKGNEVLLDEKIVAREIVLNFTWILIAFMAMALFNYLGMGAVFILAIIANLAIVIF